MGQPPASPIRANAKPLAAVTPMAHVADRALSVSWYAKLGFVAENTLTLEGRPVDDPDGHGLLVGDTEQQEKFAIGVTVSHPHAARGQK